MKCDDHREVADWIVAQPWSDGVIGSTGISYLGAAACFLASTGHPAVKAVAPLFAVHDTYADHVFPGGIKCTTVTENYDELVRALDLDLRDKLAPYPYFNDKRYAGPQPVDEDPGGTLLAAAIEEHKDSFRMRDLAPEFAFREEAASHDPGMHSGAFSPYWYLAQVPGQVHIYSVSGWYDGSAFVNGSIARFLSNPGGGQPAAARPLGSRRPHQRFALARRRAAAAVPGAGRGAALLRRAPGRHGHRPARRVAGALPHGAQGAVAGRRVLAAARCAHAAASRAGGTAHARRRLPPRRRPRTR